MFVRNRVDGQELAALAVEIVLIDDTVLTGKLLMSSARTLFDALNGPPQFIEFEPYEEQRRYLAKSALKAVRLIADAAPQSLNPKVRDMDGFDPHAILGIATGALWEDVRAAYLARAKIYHPDRFVGADLPAEVTAYLSAMARRINAAYSALETSEQARQNATVRKQTLVYSSGSREAKFGTATSTAT